MKTKPQKQAGGGKLKIDEDSRRRFMDETGCALADYSVAPGAHPFHLFWPAPVVPIFRFGVPVFLAQSFAGFLAGSFRAELLVVPAPGIRSEKFFAI